MTNDKNFCPLNSETKREIISCAQSEFYCEEKQEEKDRHCRNILILVGFRHAVDL